MQAGARVLTACVACADGRLGPALSLEDEAGRPTRLVRCGGCGLVQAEDRPGDAELARHYSHYSYDDERTWHVAPATLASLDGLARRLEPFRGAGRLLDVGCGAGVVLEAMRRRGWRVEGLELSGTAAERLRAAGFVVHLGHLETAALDPDAYDVVILSEVIEHLLEPRPVLDAARRLLRPGGIVYLTTPNFDSLSRRVLGARWRPIAVPEHLNYFNRRSLARLARAAGLEPREVWSEGVNPMQIWIHLRRGRTPEAVAAGQQSTDRLRDSACRSPWLRAAKGVVNRGLRWLRAGDTLKLVARRVG